MAMSARRQQALQNMANLGTGPEAELARKKLGAQPPRIIGARTANVTRTAGPIRGSVGSSSGRNLPVLYRGGSPAVRSTVPAVRYPRAAAKTAATKTPIVADAATKGMKMSRKSLLGIGLGMGVAAGVAMNRRGEGASSGRQSIYRY